MTPRHRITIDEARLNANYENMMDEVYLLHHRYPTNLTHMPQTASQLAAQGEADAYARNGGKGGRSTFGGSGSKCVRYECDPDYSNGIPRHK